MKETMIDDFLLEQFPAETVTVRDALLSNYTTFRLGGKCPLLVECPDAECLRKTAAILASHHIDFIVIGEGSNLLVSDEGISPCVLRYCADQEPLIEFAGNRVRVSGNTRLDDLARLCIERGVGDISFCSGIPGTVGGAIAGNAGAFGLQIGDVVESVRLMKKDGSITDVTADDLLFEYRSSVLKHSGDIVLDAVLKLEPNDVRIMMQERERILDLRRSKHPDWKTLPCAGSVFRNIEPTSAAERRQAAGWFLEEAGAGGFRVGGARLFEKHANIIVTDPGATANDVFQLTEKMVAAVRERFGFELQREIKLLGKFQ